MVISILSNDRKINVNDLKESSELFKNTTIKFEKKLDELLDAIESEE